MHPAATFQLINTYSTVILDLIDICQLKGVLQATKTFNINYKWVLNHSIKIMPVLMSTGIIFN